MWCRGSQRRAPAGGASTDDNAGIYEATLESISPLGVEPPCDIRRRTRGPRHAGTLPLHGGMGAIEAKVLSVHHVGGGTQPWLGVT